MPCRLSRNQIFIFLLILTFAIFIRFNNFHERINFGPEQAISLIIAGNYIKEKPSLLGEENVQRVTSLGHRIYHPPIYNYSLVPLLLLFNYNPILITAYFAILNIVTGIILFCILNKIFNFKVAIFSSILFLFNSTMIYHSLFIWNQNYIPLLTILCAYSTYLLAKNKINSQYKNLFLIGLFSGLGVGIEFLYLFTALIFFILAAYFAKNKLIGILIISAGFVASLFPTIIFDLRHDFYFFRTLFQYFLDTVQKPGQSSISYYHFLQFWPLFAFLGGLFLAAIYKKNRFVPIIIVVIYLIWNLSFQNTNFNEAKGMSPGLTISKIDLVAKTIADDQTKPFNVATLLDFDSRAHPLRYFLKFKYNKNPAGVELYENIEELYVFAKTNYYFDKSQVYEVNAFRPFQISVLKSIDSDYTVFKLTHSKI